MISLAIMLLSKPCSKEILLDSFLVCSPSKSCSMLRPNRLFACSLSAEISLKSARVTLILMTTYQVLRKQLDLLSSTSTVETTDVFLCAITKRSPKSDQKRTCIFICMLIKVHWKLHRRRSLELQGELEFYLYL